MVATLSPPLLLCLLLAPLLGACGVRLSELGLTPEIRVALQERLGGGQVTHSKIRTLAREEGIVIPGCAEEDFDDEDGLEEAEKKEDAEYFCSDAERPLYEQCELDHGCHHTQMEKFSGKQLCYCIGIGFRCGVDVCRMPVNTARAHCCIVAHIAAIISSLVGRPGACKPACLMPLGTARQGWSAASAVLAGGSAVVAVGAILAAAVVVRRRQWPEWTPLRREMAVEDPQLDDDEEGAGVEKPLRVSHPPL